MHFERQMPFKIYKILFFFPEKNNQKKYACLPYLNVQTRYQKHTYFFYLA